MKDEKNQELDLGDSSFIFHPSTFPQICLLGTITVLIKAKSIPRDPKKSQP
jgi:hypothetical protein